MITYYTWAMLWHDRQRYLPGVLAVAFSALLIAVQCGLLLGMFMFASLPVDHAPEAHVWLGGPNLVSVDLGRPIPQEVMSRMAAQPEVSRCEIFVQSFSQWIRPDGGYELAMILGGRLEDDAIGPLAELPHDLRAALREPSTIVMDESDMNRLGVRKVGDYAQINERKVRIVGLVSGYRGLAGCYVFCSIDTARPILRLASNQATYFLGHCKDPADIPRLVKRLRTDYPDMSAFSNEELSLRSRLHWLTKTKAGIALGYAAALGLLVGAVVTSQTLYAATASSLREYAVLWALGIPVVRMALLVLTQSLWVGVIGILLAIPAVYVLAQGGDLLGVQVVLPWWLLTGTIVVTLSMAVVSGMTALRLLGRMEPVTLLR